MSEQNGRAALYTALLAAQRAMGPVKKDGKNAHLGNRYATLQSVLDTVEGPLWDNGILLTQRFDRDEGGAVLLTELIHAASGEALTSTVPVVAKDPTDPQKIGAAITYYRRYSLLALLGLAPEDDGGDTAAQPARPQPARVAPVAPPAGRSAPPPATPAPPGLAQAQRTVARVLGPASAPPAAGVTRPVDWNQVWPEAKAQGITTSEQLIAFLGKRPDELGTAAILAKLRDEPVPVPASYAG